ncbi:MAG: pilus assembly protein PilM [candidate division KSB1 bacterium]|nr:pilus assembly protein PilM [candidate division KSB1 bacterium]MDZ7364896.1 pilus assembly protein PilM [candidate division KSB1 bacterium]MDZ7402998.1 pilus assembly protein PilM [candidate division KSB1 bacterium]
MASAITNGMVGISIRDTALRMVEITKIAGESRISRVSQGRVRAALNVASLQDRTLIRRYAEDINRLYETADFQISSGVFIIDSSLVMIKKIPIDVNLQGERFKDHMRWEVEQCMINPLEQYIIAFEPLPVEDSKDFTHAVAVVARRLVIEYLKEIFQNTDLQLRAIDVDVFAAQRVLADNYDLGEKEFIALVDIRKQGLQFSIMRGTNFYLAHDMDFHGDEPVSTATRDDDHWARQISKELRRIIIDHKLGKSVEDLRAVHLYGDGVTDGIVETLQNTHNVRIDRANPFKKIKIASAGVEAIVPSQPEAFVIPVGAALKGL